MAAKTTQAAEFEPIRTEPAYRKVAAALLERITTRALNPGDRIPSELELARQFGVHRGTVREAMRELETNGVLKRERGSKLMMVTRPARITVAAGVSRALALHDVSYHDVWEALTAIEPPIAAAAAKRRKPKDLARIDALVAAEVDMEQTAGFFRAVGEATHNGVFMLAHEPLIHMLIPSLATLIRKVPQAAGRVDNSPETHRRSHPGPGRPPGRGLDGQTYP
jgi:DNA-binding FadR family transcriptional regulator